MFVSFRFHRFVSNSDDVSVYLLQYLFGYLTSLRGIEIWRIENFQPIPLPKSDYGKFYSGDSYIVLQDEAGTAAIKSVELDAALGGRAVQYRELQGHESDKFLSYFKPFIIPLEGGVSSGFKTPNEDNFETRLYICRGRRVVRLKQVLFARSSLNHDDVFILDTEHKIYQFNGANSNIQERAKALEVVQYLKDEYHKGKYDGKLKAESDSGEFWVRFGGFAPLGKKFINEDDYTVETTVTTIYSITNGNLQLEESAASKGMFESNRCYLIDCGTDIFVWVGRLTLVEDRKAASKVAEEFLVNQNREKVTRITQVIQGFEPRTFRSKFEAWATAASSGASGGEEGKGKVAAFIKQQGLDVKGMTKGSPIVDEVPPLFVNGGKIEVWHINGTFKDPVPKEEIGKFFSGDCYIVLYAYHHGESKEEFFLSSWMGINSHQDDQLLATQLANTMYNALKGRPVQGRIFQGKEPPQFLALFQPMIVLRGGKGANYKKFLEETDTKDDTYNADGIALFRCYGTKGHTIKAVQVDADLSTLMEHFTTVIANNASILEDQDTLSTSNPGATVKIAKEGTESAAFWFALGGMQSYASTKVTEVYNFSQDDLLAEDIMILDTHTEVFLWIGECVDSKEKKKAFDIGQKYIELAGVLEGLPQDVPLYKVPEGHEPGFFTMYFSWDSTRPVVKGNSFQKKFKLLFGMGVHAAETSEKSTSSNQRGPTQRASALAALSSAFNPSSKAKAAPPKPTRSSQGSQRAAAVAALSTVLTAEQKASESSSGRFSIGSSPEPSLSSVKEKIRAKSHEGWVTKDTLGWFVTIGGSSKGNVEQHARKGFRQEGFDWNQDGNGKSSPKVNLKEIRNSGFYGHPKGPLPKEMFLKKSSYEKRRPCILPPKKSSLQPRMLLAPLTEEKYLDKITEIDQVGMNPLFAVFSNRPLTKQEEAMEIDDE
ncbi:hypothetical protein HPP92_011300 [Vanilla planifolia]|uniref:Gelsolin-like domain-containing protein n=1 Tax=Vanilla planifolia TaxID=51239 RepID=A0A835V022_VANPL|nr:hypothetical protein HPP92_011300 [Vanilla planifolia]